MKKDKIKILFTIPNFDTAGSGKAMFKIASNLNKNIFEPHIACLHDRGDFIKEIERSGIPIHIIRYTHPMDNRLAGLFHSFKVSRFFRKHKFDLIHSFHYAADYSEPLAAKLAGIKWVYTKKNMNWGGNSKNAWLLRTALASGIIYQNTDMKRYFFKNRKNTFYIPRGVDTNEFYVRNRDEKIVDEFGISDKERIVICVANIVPVKGIETLIDAFNEVADKLWNLRLFIVGDNRSDYAKSLMEYAATLKNNGRITFTGKRSDVSSFYSVSELFVLPTLKKGRMEGSPVSMLEAMASGVLVLGTEIPGIKDQLALFPELLFNPGAVDELVQKMIWALTLSDNQMEAFIKRIKAHIKEKYTIQREVSQHEQVYLKVLGKL